MQPAKTTVLQAIAALGARHIQKTDRHYTFLRTELDREINVDAPAPTDSAAGVVNPYLDEISGRELSAEVEVVIEQFLADFQYPVNRRGEPLDLRFLGPHIAYHLVRCGWRPIGNRRMIKKVAIGTGPQRVDDAVAWVNINTPDDLDPDQMTVEQLKAAPAHIQAEAVRRLNGDPIPPADGGHIPDLGKPGYETWHQPWTLDVEGDPDFKDQMIRRERAKRDNQKEHLP